MPTLDSGQVHPNMFPQFPRTHKSQLSDDELLIFDAIFVRHWLPIRNLRRGVLGAEENLPQHDLNDQELEATLKRFEADGLLHSYTFESRKWGIMPTYTLTPEGFRIWELEREPIWDLYCYEEYYPIEDSNDESVAFIRSPSLETATACLWHSDRTSMFKIKGEITTKSYFNYPMMPWKNFPQIFEVSTTVKEELSPILNWKLYYQGCTWWHSVSELSKLKLR